MQMKSCFLRAASSTDQNKHGNIMETRITKRTLLREVCNDKVHNYYYLINGRLYNADKTRYRRFKFILFFDAFDVQDFADKDSYTQQDIRELVDELAVAFVSSATYNITYDNCKQFYADCNTTINSYNRMCSYYTPQPSYFW